MKYISTLPQNADFPRHLAIMGSTGSIGCNTLRVVEAHPDKFCIEALAGGRNLTLLAQQATRWRPQWLAISDATDMDSLTALLPRDYYPEIFTGQDGFAALAALPVVDTVLSAQSGAAGLRATVAAAVAGKIICLANKESLVMAGSLLREICAMTGANILPVDSEHYAIFQCLHCSTASRAPQTVSRLILTASGGPFRGKSAEFLQNVTPQDALKHPNWSMGAKITIDSATLMNKGLEVIEACHLYGVPADQVAKQVDVVVHPQSLVHSLVEFCDASLLAQLAMPDMRLPIAACLCWPEMPKNEPLRTSTATSPKTGGTGISLLDLAKAGTLSFEAPDEAAFPCLNLARRAFAEKSTVELNAANEVAVARFLAQDIRFTDISRLVEHVLNQMEGSDIRSDSMAGSACTPLSASHLQKNVSLALHTLEARDAWARSQANHWQS